MRERMRGGSWTYQLHPDLIGACIYVHMHSGAASINAKLTMQTP